MCINTVTGMIKREDGGCQKIGIPYKKVIKHVLLKKDFIVSNTISSKTNYTVTVCTNPSCTCQDNRKYGKSVFCKHIMFIILKILDVTDEPILTNTYTGKNYLVSMFNNTPITMLETLYFYYYFFYFTSICDVHLEIYSSRKTTCLHTN